MQHIAAYEAAKKFPDRMLRASPAHLEDDFVLKGSYQIMAQQLALRVGPCPEDCLASWRERGGTSDLPSPVWVWQNAYGGDKKEKQPESYGAGLRSVLLEAELPAELMLPSQFGAWGSVINDWPIVLNDEEYEEMNELKTSDPEAWTRRKDESRLLAFQVDWEGEEWTLEHRDTCIIQAVLWQLPFDAITKAQRVVDLGCSDGEPNEFVKITYDVCTIGDDLKLSAVWRRKKQHTPSRSLWIRVLSTSAGGLAESRGVDRDWELLTILNDIEAAEDPLPRLPEYVKDDKFDTEISSSSSSSSSSSIDKGSESGDMEKERRPKKEVRGFPVAAEDVLEDILKLRDVVVVLQKPPKPDSDDEDMYEYE